jgi:hypothetical protein
MCYLADFHSPLILLFTLRFNHSFLYCIQCSGICMPIHQFNGWQLYAKQSCRLHQCHSSS